MTLLDKLTVVAANYKSSYDTVQHEKKVLEQLKLEIKDLILRRDEISASWEALRLLLEKYASHSINVLQEMLQKGLDSIITDRDYKVILQEGDNQKKDLQFLLEEKKDTGTVLAPLRSGSGHGGGVLTILSFIYQIYLLRLYNKRPFLLADESFSSVSTRYLPAFMEFVRYLVDDLEFDILHITHDERIMMYFDKTYEAVLGDIKLVDK